MSVFEKAPSYIRANHWWAYKAAPILGFTFMYFYFFDFQFIDKLSIFALSAITIVGIAGFGYVVNDVYDIEADRKAGKNNSFQGKSLGFILGAIIVLLLIAAFPWLFLKSNLQIWIALAFQITLFLVYAHPFTRLKEKSFWGPVCDALYGHAVPICIACMTYEQYLDLLPYSRFWFFTTLFVWQFFKGLRNIFLHQLEDYENDLKSGINTLTTKRGQNAVYQYILKLIIPMEVLGLLGFIWAISGSFPGLWLYCVLFLVIYIFGHGLFRNVVWDSKVYSKNTYIYFLNNFYETYLPYFYLLLCVLKTPSTFILLLFYIILFPSTVRILLKDFKMAIMELWVQFKRILFPLYKFLQSKDV